MEILRNYIREILTEAVDISTAHGGVMVNGIPVNAEIASTPSTRQQGLMFRQEMGDDSGMLFVFPDSARRSFWMKDTPLPLSIAYTNNEGYILNIEDMDPLVEEHTYSNGPARCALEMNQGWFHRNGIRSGHRITGIPGVDK